MDTDHSRDEMRRVLRDADEAHHAAMPAFTEALKRFFSKDSKDNHVLSMEEKAGFLSVPIHDRRAFLKGSGVVVVGAVALAACSSDDDASGSSTTTAGGSPTTDAGAAPTKDDVALATAAIQIENTAVAAYMAVAGARAADLKTAGAYDAAALFMGHHQQHAKALNALLTDNGAAAIPEDQLFDGIALPSESDIMTLPITDIAAFARGLENTAAATYITAVPKLSLPVLRQALMGIGGAEARHVTAYDLLLGGGAAGYVDVTSGGGSYPTTDSLLA